MKTKSKKIAALISSLVLVITLLTCSITAVAEETYGQDFKVEATFNNKDYKAYITNTGSKTISKVKYAYVQSGPEGYMEATYGTHEYSNSEGIAPGATEELGVSSNIQDEATGFQLCVYYVGYTDGSFIGDEWLFSPTEIYNNSIIVNSERTFIEDSHKSPLNLSDKDRETLIKGFGLLAVIALIVFLRSRQKKKAQVAPPSKEITPRHPDYKTTDVANSKGSLGEQALTNELNNNFHDSYILNNLYISKSGDKTTEIDVLMINEYGIFVFENKNYSGWIFGKYKDKNWTQSLESGEKNQFYNPIRQNESHIKALKNYLNKNGISNLASVPVYSIVVFENKATFKNVNTEGMPLNTSLLQLSDVSSYIKGIMLRSPEGVISADVQNALYSTLKDLTNVSDGVKVKHVEYVNGIKE